MRFFEKMLDYLKKKSMISREIWLQELKNSESNRKFEKIGWIQIYE